MSDSLAATDRRRLEGLDRAALEAVQLQKLNGLLARLRGAGGMYRELLADAPTRLDRIDQIAGLPFTDKDALIPDTDDQPARNHTAPLESYVRLHQTSGTRGRPLMVLDTALDWQWWIDCWAFVLDAAGVTRRDRAVLAFSFGPFIGFWSAFDALAARGVLAAPAGGMGSAARIDLIRRVRASVLLCTPTYAMRLADEAVALGCDPAGLGVERIIVAGEPGGSVPAVRQRIEQAWGARLTDHSGASEVGPWGYGDPAGRGLHVLESEFIAEFLSVESGRPAAEGELSHLILTSLGRWGSPVVRYRTGDLVRPSWRFEGDNRFVHLAGGVLGRADDMLVIRGVNVFPSAIDAVLLDLPGVAEYRVTARKRGAMDDLLVEVEPRTAPSPQDSSSRPSVGASELEWPTPITPQQVAEQLRLRIGLSVEVTMAPPGSLPRSEGKSRRFIDKRGES
ncbi:Phenylacetate-coenzyme A ligase [Pirellulimonas nuda]|uniref:Phenylacetate-coenzyme A ligase n=1 Tax=Pirellulimonas nuda TaxID=2528009 RepID=A0A518DJM9_9BACT|nr:phenylacetate--CoA ligase [Pirellulimonas nuda]QDU91689.1 Phenylacetate-coenzyme A ligase [Pirellulimonas nuda]